VLQLWTQQPQAVLMKHAAALLMSCSPEPSQLKELHCFVWYRQRRGCM